MTDLDKATQQFSSRERRTTRIAESVAADCVVTFAITAGIFGVGQPLAEQASGKRKDRCLHIGPWVDWRHTAICIKFDSVEDGKLSEDVVRLGLEGARS